ncbi:hypothetical protein C7B69_16220 [filamentous cyanobacterium Phorm 46]|nr:hypothetical protein C7B69_16220 [filamentous cyanobacterium Phorm 46]PSB53459.1 hypothetical protein C7B67_03065 [filamentous cyanobacterium Phorm 6]
MKLGIRFIVAIFSKDTFMVGNLVAMPQYAWVSAVYSPEIPLNPPKARGTLRRLLFPPKARGARGDLGPNRQTVDSYYV